MDHTEAQSTQAVEKYVLGELSPIETEAFEQHYFACTECAEELKVLALFQANLRAIFEEEEARSEPAEPARVKVKPSWWQRFGNAWRQPFFAPTAVAALLLLGISGFEAVTIRGLREQVAATSETAY